MNREEAWELVKKNVKNRNLRKHMLATEAVMRDLAVRLGEDEELWGLVGIIHDVDYEKTVQDPKQHGLVSVQMLEELGVEEDIKQAIKAHAGHIEPETKLDKALFAVDPLTGLIVAAALIHPDKSLNSIDTQFVLNRFKEKSFARGANRRNIATCENLGLSLEEFITISLRAMQKISAQLGLE
jgi:putative nucleotidyltransferase with HDIG domain